MDRFKIILMSHFKFTEWTKLYNTMIGQDIEYTLPYSITFWPSGGAVKGLSSAHTLQKLWRKRMCRAVF
jgi:hypothetical protein